MKRILTHERFEPFTTADQKIDIAIIGAGISGAYAAWRLKQKHPDKHIVLFEYSNRVGGRLYSKTLPGMPNVHAELGGMRYIPATQKLVAELIEHLDLPTPEFPMGAPGAVGNSNNIMYLRRRLLRVRDLTDPAKVPYLLNPPEQGLPPDQLQSYVLYSLFPNANSFTQDEWYHATVFNGQPLYKLGFWNLLDRVLSSEAYQFMKEAGGYYTNVANINAVSALPIDEFATNIHYRTLTQGYQHLPIAIVDQFVERLHGEFRPNHRLAALGRVAGQPYALRFIPTITDEANQTQDQPDARPLHIHADEVILAMPRRSLELINWSGFEDKDAWFRTNLSSVISQAAFKIFLGYPYPWWRELGLVAGRSITDMPIRQTYYFQTEGEVGPDPKNQNSLMMVSYNDSAAVPFWKGLEGGDPFEGNPNPFVPNAAARVQPHRFTITRQMVDAAQEQVREVHGLKYVPEPYTGIYQDWTEDPYGGGWHGWKAGVEYWKVMPQMRQPIPNERVFICGEAYSDVHGWVEGALRTAELMLEEHFGLPRPAWLSPDYDLGPSQLLSRETAPSPQLQIHLPQRRST